MATFPAFLDTCALYGAYLCDTLLCLAEATTFRPLWSADVLEELGRNLLKLGLAEEAVERRIGEMRRWFPDAMVRGYEDLAQNMSCDPKDRHVLAAAVRGNAEVLVTFNLKDFPEESTAISTSLSCTRTSSCSTSLTCIPVPLLRHCGLRPAATSPPRWTSKICLGASPTAGVPRFAAETRRHL